MQMAKAPPPSAITDWGIPDPRKAAGYPPAAGTLPTEWAWEFLRRSEDYRRRWVQLIREQGHRVIVATDGTVRPVSKSEADAARSAGKTVKWSAPREVLRVEFRVHPSRKNETLDPREKHAPLFEGREIVHEILSEPEVKFPQVGILFDVSLPLKPQVDAAWNHLKKRSSHQPASRRPQFRKFTRYLRLLDFQAIGAPDPDIGERLFPNARDEQLRDLIRDTLDQAHGWQHDYLLIALHSSAYS
jgi:hypothetical protein